MNTQTTPRPHPSEPPEPLAHTPVEFIDVGHARIAYRKLGAGPDVLFIHGWPLSSATFRELAPLIAEHFTCHLVDLPGTGQTHWDDDSRISLPQHAHTLAQVVDALGLKRYAILAHDSGAVIGRLLAAKHGKRVWGLVMGNTEVPGHRPKLVELYAWAANLPGGARLLPNLLRSRALLRSPLGFAGCFDQVGFIDGAFHRVTIAPLLASKRAAHGQMQLVTDFDWSLIDNLAEVHKQITAPVRMIWGADDPFFPLDRARGIVNQFPGGATIDVIRPGKLFVHEEFPEEFAEHALEFLNHAGRLLRTETRATH